MSDHDTDRQRCGGTGMVAYWDGSAYAGEMCRGCIDCERHDSQCETELTSHGYTPCRCDERAGICICEIDRHDFNCPVHNDADHPKRGPNGDEP